MIDKRNLAIQLTEKSVVLLIVQPLSRLSYNNESTAQYYEIN